MPKNPTNTRRAEERTDQQLGVMLTKDEKAMVKAYARELGLSSMSAAARVLILRGMAVTDSPVFARLTEER